MKTLDPGHVLSRILDAKRKRLADAKMRVPEAIVKRMASMEVLHHPFRAALQLVAGTQIIAEIKKASPSAGVLIDDLDVVSLAKAYAAAGASAVSVVTEEDSFHGNLRWIREAAYASALPILRKDFIFDPYQVFETRAAGASAILLIVAMLEPKELKHLIAAAGEAGLDALVEVHDERELEEALEAGAGIVGINNRDLKTFEVQLETSLLIGSKVPDNVLLVAESGIHSRKDIELLGDAGADAFLVGEMLIRSSDPAMALKELL